jgi:hypothetical protein
MSAQPEADRDITRWLNQAAHRYGADADLRERIDTGTRHQRRRARAVLAASTAALVVGAVAAMSLGRDPQIVTTPASLGNPTPNGTTAGALEAPNPTSGTTTLASPANPWPCDTGDPYCGEPCTFVTTHWSGYRIDAGHPGPISIEVRLLDENCVPRTDLSDYDLTVTSTNDGVVNARQWTTDTFHVELTPVTNGQTQITLFLHRAGDIGGGSFSGGVTVDLPGAPNR